MGVKYSVAEAEELIMALEKNLAAANQLSNQMVSGIDNVTQSVNSGQLSGAAHEAAVGVFETILKPTINRLNEACNDVKGDLKTFERANNEIAHYVTLDQDSLDKQLAIKKKQRELINRQLDQNRGFFKIVDSMATGKLDDLMRQDRQLKTQRDYILEPEIKGIQKKLDQLEEFTTVVSPLFQDSLTVFMTVAKGAQEIRKITFNSNGTYVSNGADLTFLADLDSQNLDDGESSEKIKMLKKAINHLQKPDNMTQAEFKKYRQKVYVQLEELGTDGWVAKSLTVYVTSLNKNVKNDKWQKDLTSSWDKAHNIGSKLFTSMLDKSNESDQFGAKRKIRMLYQVLDASVDNPDTTNFVQLKNVANAKYHFPNSNEIANSPREYYDFVDQYSNLISQKYKNKVLNNPIDNQMRYWLDKPIVEFINDKGLDQNEYESWLKTNRISIDHPDSSLHNRTLSGKGNIPNNSKVTAANNHVEIIFNNKGKTVSVWNVLDTYISGSRKGEVISDPRQYEDVQSPNSNLWSQIANTDSANYAIPHNGFNLETPFGVIDKDYSGKQHEPLDVKPAASNKGLESQIRVMAKKWYLVKE